MGDLENVSVEYLREIWKKIGEPDAVRRLSPAILYKEVDDMTKTDAAAAYGYSSGWASIWFDRLERLADEPFEEVVYDESRSGRPPKLSDQQRKLFEEDLQVPPEEVGIDAPAWSVPLARQYLQEEFDVDYSERHVRRLLKEAGLSWKTAQPECYKSDERSQEAWQEGSKKSATTWTTSTQSSQ